MPTFDPRRIAIIGFGEVGGIFARDLVASGRHDVAAYDILMDDPKAAAPMHEKARALRVAACASAAAASGASVVISAVTAASAQRVAEDAASLLEPGQLFLDVNSVSPDTKRLSAAAVECSGAHYVEAAVMAAVAPYGLKVPILLGGPHAGALKDILAPAGMVLEVAAAEIGKASATNKMCRSVMMKGLEALAVECLYAARHYGVEDAVLASLRKTYPGMDWQKLGGYWLGRTIEHGRRRAAEMRESAATVAETGLAPLMAEAVAERQDWVADRVAEQPALRLARDADWRTTLDAMGRAISRQEGRDAVSEDR